MDCSPPGFSVNGILQARILEWIVMPSAGDLSNPGIEPTQLLCTHTHTPYAQTTHTVHTHTTHIEIALKHPHKP